MYRLDLTTLTDADLVRASSAGLLKRAVREMASTAPPEVAVVDASVSVTWPDGLLCTFPPGSGLSGGRCNCGAVDICRHLLRSVLYLRSQAEPATPLLPDVAPAVIDLIAAGDAEIATRFGAPAVRRASRQLAGGKLVASVDHERREVFFPALGIRTQVPIGADETSIVCDCRQSGCSHAILAVLLLRGKPADTGSEPEQHEHEPTVATGVTLAPVRRLLEEWLHVGVDGLSTSWHEMAHTAALELDKKGLGRASTLLETLAKLIEAEQRGSGRADPERLRWAFAALWLRAGSVAPPVEQDEKAPSGARRTYLAGSSRTLVGLGTAGWWGADVYGITAFLLDERTGEILTAGTGRPIDESASAAHLAARAPVVGGYTARELFGRRLECSAVRLTDDGRVALDPAAHCQFAPIDADWASVAKQHGVTRFSELAEKLRRAFPSFLHLRRPDTFLLVPSAFGAARFDASRQAFDWPIADRDGIEAHLVVRHRKERTSAIKRLQKLASGRPPGCLVGRLRRSSRRIEIEPVTLVWSAEGKTKTHQVDVDAG